MGILDAQQLPGLIFSLLDLKLTFHSPVGQTEECVLGEMPKLSEDRTVL